MTEGDGMQTIEELLNRIRWDPQFGRGEFEIAYWDRVEKRAIRVPLERLETVAGDHFAFEVIDRLGVVHSVPFHRVVDVFRDGERIWHREIPHHHGDP